MSSQSNGPRRSRKAAERPKKPYPGFPLTPHASGAWQKKIAGKVHYFGKWGRVVNGVLTRIQADGCFGEALKEYEDYLAGRAKDGLTVADLCNQFLTAKLRRVESGELGKRMFADYKEVTDLIVAAFGANRKVDDLAPRDFEQLRARMARDWGPVRLGNGITRVKSVFKYATENGLTEKAIRFGGEFKKPDRSVLRRHRAKGGEKMFEAAELRRLIDAATVQLRAMILLGVNAGFGNHDCATLPLSALVLDRGWVNFARPKTGIARRCPLWPETVAAIRAAVEARPEPQRYEDCGVVFLNSRGSAWIRTTDAGHRDLISYHFRALVERLKLHRGGVGFYSLRHTFRTVADASRDAVAIDLIMGHTDPSMGANYRERIDDARLVAVTDHVRRWLFGGEADGPNRGDDKSGGRVDAPQEADTPAPRPTLRLFAE